LEKRIEERKVYSLVQQALLPSTISARGVLLCMSWLQATMGSETSEGTLKKQLPSHSTISARRVLLQELEASDGPSKNTKVESNRFNFLLLLKRIYRLMAIENFRYGIVK